MNWCAESISGGPHEGVESVLTWLPKTWSNIVECFRRRKESFFTFDGCVKVQGQV